MINKFEEILDILKKQPGIGTRYKDGMRKIRLGMKPILIYLAFGTPAVERNLRNPDKRK